MTLEDNLPVLILPRVKLGKAIVRRGHIWQMDFLTAEKLAEFVRSRGLPFRSEHIIRLWRIGLLRADYVVRPDEVRRTGFRHVGTDRSGHHLYADIRARCILPKGWPAAAALQQASRCDTGKPLFHGFRYLVLYHLATLLQFTPFPGQSLVPARQFHQLLDEFLTEATRKTRSAGFIEAVDNWNEMASLAVMSEPNMYIRIFGVLSHPSYISRDEQAQKLAEHWRTLSSLYRRIGLPRLRQIREDMCWVTRMIEPNENVHTLLCLAGREDRLKLEGRLGGALLVRTMTEMIRRMAEDVFETELPEEDVHPARLRAAWTKENLYGSRRLLDDRWEAADEFARGFGLRYGPYVRWYVEGSTEYSAVQRLLSLLGLHDVAVINLHGVVKSKGFTNAIREALNADLAGRIFSFISIDGDRPDNVKVLRIAAHDDIFCGAFFISTPNFECYNFTREELEVILWKVALGKGARRSDHTVYMSAVRGWDYEGGNIDDLFRRAQRALRLQHGALHKGNMWGERLMDYAWEHPQHPKQSDGTMRDIMKTVRLLSRTRITNFHIMRRDYRVDENTGEMVARDS